MGEDDERTLVVIYDWCIPRPQFQEIIPPRVEFAHHIFACLAIKENAIRQNDQLFFSHVAEVFGGQYPGAKILIITQDQGFVDEICDHEAYKNKRIDVLTIAPCNSEHLNRKRAFEVTEKLLTLYRKEPKFACE